MKAFGVPDSLAEIDQWLLWRRERGTKVPYMPSGKRASSTDPATWCTYLEALEAWRKRTQYWAGIGFVFHEADPFIGIDLDDSLDAQGNVKPWARGIVERFADTYTEISPSGCGLKIWARGAIPANLGKAPIGDGGIEMYDHARYFAVTGRAFRGAPLEVEDHAADVTALYAHLTRGKQQYRIGDGGRIRHGTQHLSLVSIAGTLRRRGVCEEAIEACLQAINRYQCERPGPPANISRIVRSTQGWVQ
jgi:primase-polymerase (primpol)-like protein